MKHFFAIFISTIFIFILSSCQNKNNIMLKSQPKIDLLKDAIVTLHEKTIKCNVSKTQEGSTQIKITDPEPLIGMTFNQQDNSISYKELMFKSSKSSFFPNSFFSSFFNILDEIEKPDSLSYISSDGIYTFYSGKLQSNEFKIKVKNSSNTLEQISIDDLNIHVNFI